MLHSQTYYFDITTNKIGRVCTVLVNLSILSDYVMSQTAEGAMFE